MPAKRKISKEKRRKRIFTMRDLAIPPQYTFEEYLVYLSEHPEVADQYLRPGEVWAVEIYGNQTLVPFSSASLFGPSGYLGRYDGIMASAQDPGRTDELINNIRVIKVGNPGDSEEQVEDKHREQRDAQKARAEAITKQAEKIFPTKEKAEGRKPSKQSIIESALAMVKKFSKQVKSLEKRFAEIEKASKKTAKKQPKKKVAKKKVTKKPTPKKKVAKNRRSK